LIEITKTDL